MSREGKSRDELRLCPDKMIVVPAYLSSCFVFVDLAAGFVLFLVELVLLGLGQVTVVGGHIGLFLVLSFCFAILQVGSLSRRELVVLDAVGDAVLLVLLAGVHFVDTRMIGIDYARARAGGVVLGLSWSLSRGGANNHQTTRCQD